MMSTNLPVLLASSKMLLGPKFKNLGKKQGFLLSYGGNKGWAIERFNEYKQILRLFGFYPSTHSSIIKTQLLKEGLAGGPLLEYFYKKERGR